MGITRTSTFLPTLTNAWEIVSWYALLSRLYVTRS